MVHTTTWAGSKIFTPKKATPVTCDHHMTAVNIQFPQGSPQAVSFTTFEIHHLFFCLCSNLTPSRTFQKHQTEPVVMGQIPLHTLSAYLTINNKSASFSTETKCNIYLDPLTIKAAVTSKTFIELVIIHINPWGDIKENEGLLYFALYTSTLLKASLQHSTCAPSIIQGLAHCMMGKNAFVLQRPECFKHCSI